MKYLKYLLIFWLFIGIVNGQYLGSYLYVDGTLASGNNDGGADGTDPSDSTEAANWTNAYQSVAGLQSAFDAGGYSFSFTSGSTEPTVGDTITGNTSGATARVAVVDVSSGTWGGGDAAGKIYFSIGSGTFQAETVDVDGGIGDDHLTCSGAEALDGHLTIFVRNTFTVTATIDKDTNQQPNFFWWRVVGCSGTSGPVSQGSYVTMDSSGTDLTGAPIINTTLDHLYFYGIRVLSPGGASAPDSGEDGFNFASGSTGVVLENCSAEDCYFGVDAVSGGSTLINCFIFDNRIRGFSTSHGSAIIGGTYEWGPTHSEGTLVFFGGISCLSYGATFIDGTKAIDFDSTNSGFIINCNIISPNSVGVEPSNSGTTIVVLNTIFDLETPAAPGTEAIGVDFGRTWEDYNLTDGDDRNFAGFLPWSNSTINQTMGNTDPWDSITGDDFRLNRGSTAADIAFAGGIPLWWDASSPTVNTFIGAVIGYDLPEIANVTSSDTVYGDTGTASAGSGGGQPVIGGSVVR